MKTGSGKVKEESHKILKVYSAINIKLQRYLEDRTKLREIEKIILTDLLELLVLLCSITMQQ